MFVVRKFHSIVVAIVHYFLTYATYSNTIHDRESEWEYPGRNQRGKGKKMVEENGGRMRDFALAAIFISVEFGPYTDRSGDRSSRETHV